MSSRAKKICVFILVLAAVLSAMVWYRRAHPPYTPPPPRVEVIITIIPGWNLRQVAEYLVEKKIASSTERVYAIIGEPARDYRSSGLKAPGLGMASELIKDKPDFVSYEGYLAPETYRVFKDAPLADVIAKLISQRNKEITPVMREEILKQKRTFHEMLTMASLLEKEVQRPEDKALVANILWRRFSQGWALQVDSSVHYALDKRGVVFTKKQEREFDSYWNTYKYPGLPLGPIANPGLAAISAAINPAVNDYWYFLTTKDGEVKYARTLEEHNANKARYLQ